MLSGQCTNPEMLATPAHIIKLEHVVGGAAQAKVGRFHNAKAVPSSSLAEFPATEDPSGLRCTGGIVLLGCATHRHQSWGPFGPPVVCHRVLAHMPFWRPHMVPTMPEHNECACVSTICTHWHMLHNVVVAGCGCSAMWCGKPHTWAIGGAWVGLKKQIQAISWLAWCAQQ